MKLKLLFWVVLLFEYVVADKLVLAEENSVLYYTTIGNSKIDLEDHYEYDDDEYIYCNYMDASVLSNTYSNSQGTITFSGTLHYIQGYNYINTPFGMYSSLQTVKIPEGVNTIGDYAFSFCTNLQTINFPSTLQWIYSNAFQNCTSVKNFNLPEGLTYIGDNAFNYCIGTEKFDLPSTLKTIGTDAFYFCTGSLSVNSDITYYNSDEGFQGGWFYNSRFDSITFNKPASWIGNWACYLCTNLKKVKIASSVSSIGTDAFKGCSGLTEVDVDWSTPITITQDVFSGSNYKNATLLVPYGSKSKYESASIWKDFGNIVEKPIPNNMIIYTSTDGNIVSPYSTSAFGASITSNSYSNGLGIIEFDSDIKYISSSAFYTRSKLKSIKIPNHISYIGDEAFYGCTSLSSVDLGSNLKRIGKNAFYNTAILTNLSYDNDIKYIGTYAINCKSSLSSSTLTIKEGTTLIADYMCQSRSINELLLPSSLEYIGNSAFQSCYISNFVIPENVKKIGSYAFYGSSLKSLSIPPSVISIEQYAFASSGSLKEVVFEDGEQDLYLGTNEFSSGMSRGVFGQSFYIEKAYIGRNISTEKNGPFVQYGTSDKLTSIEIGSNVSSIVNYTLGRNEHITTIICHAESPTSYSYFADATYNNAVVYVPEQHLSEYKTSWSEFSNVQGVNLNGDIADGNLYVNIFDRLYTSSSYSRTFNNTNWQALYVPFSIPVDTLNKYGIEVAELNDTHMYDKDDDGTFEEVTVEFLRKTAGSTEANYPYLIRAKETGEKTIVFNNVELKTAASTSIDCSTVKQKFTFTGTYEGVSGSDMYSNNYYAMSGGALSRVSNANVDLKPQRWYMSVENRDGSAVEYYAPAMRIVVDGEWTEETGLDTIDGSISSTNIFDLQGRKVNASALKSGIYVKGGKKIIIK